MRTRLIQSSSDPVPSSSSNTIEVGHRSVLLQEAIELLTIKAGDVVVDATLGGAGHAREIVQQLGPQGIFIGFDLDHDAIERARASLASAGCRVHLIEANFRTLESALDTLSSHPKGSVSKIDKALFDLGWSTFQLNAGRGFSFQKDEPLLMTYSKEPQGLTAKTIVNEWSETSLADIIFGWGEERYSRRIAKAIVDHRETKPFETSQELGEVIKAAVPVAYRFGRLHPATKTFQALRIAVNDELGALKEGIRGAWNRLADGGRIAVITFHSIEDREVKRLFASLVKEEGATLVMKKPLAPSAEEIKANPRARSAKLRVIQKDLHSEI